jgi:hypothetical protein
MADLLNPPNLTLAADWLEARRDHLLGEVATKRRRPSRRRYAVAAALCAVLILVGTAVATGGDPIARVREWHERDAKMFPTMAPHPVGPFVYITRGDGWALIGWRSTRGLCVDFTRQFRGMSSSGGNCFAEKKILGWTGQSGSSGAVTTGVIAPQIARVEVDLCFSRREAAIYPAPAALHTDKRFFLLRDGPYCRIRAYDARGVVVAMSKGRS